MCYHEFTMAEKINKQKPSDEVFTKMMAQGITPEVRQIFLDAGKFDDCKSLRDYLRSVSNLKSLADQIRDDVDDLDVMLNDVFLVLSQARLAPSGESALKVFLQHLLD